MKTVTRIISSVLALWAIAHPALVQAGNASKKSDAQSVIACSALTEWQASESGKMLKKGRPGSADRDHVYAAFADTFWRSIDQRHAKKKPEKVRDVFNNIQNAFLEASRQYGGRIKSFGVTPQLLFYPVLGPTALEKVFTARQLAREKNVFDDKAVQDLMKEKDGYNIEIRFIRKPGDYLVIKIFDHLQPEFTPDSPISSVLANRPDPDLFNGPGMWGKLHCENLR